jgi:hypothetical protein
MEEFSDECFDCGRQTPPYKTLTGGMATRSFHTCEVEHEARTHADWWSDWVGSEIVERMMIFDPSKGDGGTTWSGIPLTPELIEATRLPAPQPEPESSPIQESLGFRLGRRFGGWLF